MPIINIERGDDVVITHPDLVNIYGCSIGKGSRIGPFVEIQKGSCIGRNCKISSHTFICEGVTIEDEVFVGHGVMFTNDLYPRATTADGSLQGAGDWELVPTLIKRGASIGSNATIVAGVVIGKGSLVAAGAVVTRRRTRPRHGCRRAGRVVGDASDHEKRWIARGKTATAGTNLALGMEQT